MDTQVCLPTPLRLCEIYFFSHAKTQRRKEIAVCKNNPPFAPLLEPIPYAAADILFFLAKPAFRRQDAKMPSRKGRDLVSCFLPLVSFFLPLGSCLLPLASWFLVLVSCFLFLFSWLLLLASCFLALSKKGQYLSIPLF